MPSSHRQQMNETNETSSYDSRQRRIGGGFWNDWRTVENEKLKEVNNDGQEKAAERQHSSSSSAEDTDSIAHLFSTEENSDQLSDQQSRQMPLPPAAAERESSDAVPPFTNSSEEPLPLNVVPTATDSFEEPLPPNPTATGSFEETFVPNFVPPATDSSEETFQPNFVPPATDSSEETFQPNFVPTTIDSSEKPLPSNFVPPATTDSSEETFQPNLQQIASSSSPSAASSSPSSSVCSSPKNSSDTHSAAESNDNEQMPSSNLGSSTASSKLSMLSLSPNELKNLRFFINAIDQSKLAIPIALEDKLKVLDWLGISEGNDGKEKKKKPILKIRRKSDPAFVRRNAHQFATASPTILTNGNGNGKAAQIIRKWSTKSNSNGTELIRTLREQFGGRSAGNIVSRANSGRSTSSPSSRPQLAFLVRQSDSAIGSSLCGSCSFLPPPPPYRPLRCSSGSEGALPSMDTSSIHAHHQHQITVEAINGDLNGEGEELQQRRMVGCAKDFTSLLGFDCIGSMMRDCERNGDGGETEERETKREREESNETLGAAERRGTNQQTLLRKIESATTMELKVPPDEGQAKRRHRTASAAETLLTADGCDAQAQAASPSPSPSMSASCSDFPGCQERLQRVQPIRDSLPIQVAALSRQVALQREKIRDLEDILAKGTLSKQYFQGTGQSEQQQNEIGQQLAELRHNYLTMERDKTERTSMMNDDVERLCQQSVAQQKDNKINELERLQTAVQRLIADNEQKNSLIKTLQNALEEQQRHMFDASLLQQQSDVPSHQLDINDQIRRILLTDDLSLNGSDHSMMAHSSSFPAGLCAQQQSFRAASSPRLQPLPTCSGVRQHLPMSTSFSSSLSHLGMVPPPPLWRVSSPPPIIPPHKTEHPPPQHQQPQLEQPSTSSSGRTPTSPLARQLAAELDELRQSGLGALLRQPYSSASLPRSIHSKTNPFGTCITNRLRHGECPTVSSAMEHAKSESGAGRGGIGTPFWAHWVRRVFRPTPKAPQKQRAHSTPNLAPSRKISREETVESDDESALASSARCSVPNSGTSNGHLSAKQLKRGRRARSTLRSFLGRFAHRGNSLQDVRPSQRLSPSLLPLGVPSSCVGVRPPISQFVDWDRAHCSRWLTEVGFGDAFVGAVRSGRHLLNMAETDLETELGIRSALQRKRLKCLLDRIERNSETEAADKMDTNLVMLWLDQIGLPQLRDIFAENRVDGHLLLVLSVQDLFDLGIQSALNHASLARAIQFLRSADFHLHRLEKHFSSDSLEHCPIPAEVERWSHCCAVEWLRSEDLSEFTPNLAFSGLHGALMVYEPMFTAESLAEMLQIPPTKSLIRRHLTTQFHSLLGQQIVGNKRDTVSQPMATYLSPGLKIRLTKRGFSLGRKKSKSDIFVEPEVRVCPEEVDKQQKGVTLNERQKEEMSEV